MTKLTKPIMDAQTILILQERYYGPILKNDPYLAALVAYLEAGGEPPEEDE